MNFRLALIASSLLLLAACGEKAPEPAPVPASAPLTQEQKVKQQITERVYALNADERMAAETNAKQFFEKQWPQTRPDGTLGRVRGFFNECRPSDSNANGLVTCFGKVPQMGGGYEDMKRYCGYRPELVGCSDEDTVK